MFDPTTHQNKINTNQSKKTVTQQELNYQNIYYNNILASKNKI